MWILMWLTFDASGASREECRKLQWDLQTGLHPRYFDYLDQTAGSMGLGSAEQVTRYRTSLEAAAGICESHGWIDCTGVGFDTSSATNRRHDWGQLCAPAKDASATLASVLRRDLESQVLKPSSEGSDVETLRTRRGWLHSTDAIEYATYFRAAPKQVERVQKLAKEMHAAADLPVESDFAWMSEPLDQWYETLKASVDATAGEWTVSGTACSGYVCDLPKAWVKSKHPSASVRAVTVQGEWQVVTNELTSVPKRRNLSVFATYQVPGEPHCQVRSFEVTEKYVSGSYSKASSPTVGFVRFQRCP